MQAGDRREIYHYDRGRLTTRTVERAQDPAGKTYTYRYDAQGNTLSDGENTYLYDCLNRIAEVQTKAGDIQKNHYDAEGLRSQMEENGKLVSFIYADREVIAEEDEAGEHIRYIRGHELLASDSERARTYYHYACDEMGSITDITDCDGTVLNHYAYDAFGNRTVEEETVENRFGFAGEMLDAVTGQYYLRARFYNPVIARFLSEDTYYGDGLNLYAYCHNNPVGYVDPSGHICEKKQHTLDKYKEYKTNGLGKKEAYVMAQYETILKYEGSDAANRYLGKYGVDIQVGSYKDLRKQKGKSNRQVHHLNQDAAFRSKIKKKDGLSINLEGHALRDTESSHYKAHESMERFWNQYRKGGIKEGGKVRVSDYNVALYQSLQYAGMSKMNAAYATTRAIGQQKKNKVGVYVPRVPGKMRQKRSK